MELVEKILNVLICFMMSGALLGLTFLMTCTLWAFCQLSVTHPTVFFSILAFSWVALAWSLHHKWSEDQEY